MNVINEQIKSIKHRIAEACLKAGRQPNEVRMLLATKTVSPERIKMALQAGERLIGENKVQELRDKYDELEGTFHEKHFIGHLQSNKIKDVLKYGVSCIQSMDRLSLAQKLDQRLRFEKKTMDVLIQVNTSGEQSKFGVRPEDALDLVHEVSKFSTISIKGLMTIGLFSSEAEQVRRCFQTLKRTQHTIQKMAIPNVAMGELSMGMSGDLEIAIEEGATLIRVGTAIFGQRDYPDSYYWPERN